MYFPMAHSARCRWALLITALLGACTNDLPTAPVVITGTSTLQATAPVRPREFRVLTSFADYRTELNRHNPQLQSSRLNHQASIEDVRASGRLPDPQIHVGHFTRQVETRVGPQNNRVGISQKFPAPGFLDSERRAAQARAAEAGSMSELTALTLQRELVSAYNDMVLLNIEHTNGTKGLEWIQKRLSVLKEEMTTGRAGLDNVLKLQRDEARLTVRLTTLVDHRHSLGARLNRLLGRPVDTALPPPGAFHTPATLIDIKVPATHPILVAQDKGIVASQALLNKEQAKRLPDLTARLEWIDTGRRHLPGRLKNNGRDPLLLSLSFNIPFGGDVSARIRRESLSLSARTRQRADLILNLDSQLKEATWRRDEAQRRLQLHTGTLLPSLKRQLDLLLEGTRQGTSSFGDIVHLRLEELELRTAAARARHDFANALAHLHFLTANTHSGGKR